MTGTQREESVWGSDTTVSLPQPLETPDANMIDMEGFCFTPTGLRLNLTAVDREELLRSGFGPRDIDGPIHG